MQLITAENGDPKRLQRSLSAILAEPDPVIPHTADVFSDFFIDKVARIHALSANAPMPTFPAAMPTTLAAFAVMMEDAVTQLVMNSPCKLSQADPLPTW